MLYKCQLCDMSCPSPSALANHCRYKHSEAKPYRCDLCPYKAKSVGDLNAHEERIHEGITNHCPYPNCKYKSKSQSNVRVHVQKVHDGASGQLYRCHLCSKTTVRGHYMTQHLRRIHKLELPSGHSRFKYRECEDGFFELQTVRFEGDEEGTIKEEIIF